MEKKKIIKLGKKLYKKNLTIATSGNLSIKTDKGILITTSGSSLGNLDEKDVVLIDFEGNEQENKKASSEKMLHVEIYKQRPEIRSIIHTHPVYLTSFAACHKTLKEPIMSENILYFEEIPVAEYAMPSSKKLVENTVKYLKDKDVVMMANHGAIAIADTIEKAFAKLETAEYYAHVSLNTIFLGGAKMLSDKDINDLIELKKGLS
ncbi:class II aldolase/adducin family protein [bacterium]|nr:class II aldolase/adducin family protein [bacterium]